MIDLNRVLIYTKLPHDEANRFRERLRLNQEMLEDFIESRPDGDLVLVNLAPKDNG